MNAAAWWHRAVFYEIYPRSFQDTDGDGVGDLRGITSRLDYLVDLGADAIWLSPIYPSPLVDFGYDISDFMSIDPVLGTLDDFEGLVDAAHARGLRVVTDLTPAHTSIEHPWFRQNPDWYVRVEGEVSAQQLGDRVRNARVVARSPAAWLVVPPLVLPRAAEPRLDEPRSRRRHAAGGPLLGQPRGGRLQTRLGGPYGRGPAAAR